MTTATLSGDQAPAPAPAGGLTGRRRIAFASYVDESRLPGFLTLLRSLALSNPKVCEDFVVLNDGLSADSVARIRALHPRTDLRAVGTERYERYAPGEQPDAGRRRGEPGHRAYYGLDVFRIRDYDTVITLDPGSVITGDLGELLRLREGLAVVMRPAGAGRGRAVAGPMVIQRPYLTDAFCERVDAVGRGGSFAGERSAGPLLDSVLDGKVVPVEGPYSDAEEDRRPLELSDADFYAAYLALKGAGHHDLLVHFGTRHVGLTGHLDTARRVALAHLAAGEYDEAVRLLRSVPIPSDEAWPHEVLGHALMSVSRYEEARAQLLLATADPRHAPTAFSRLAQIAWIHGDDALALRYATDGLAVDPTHPAARRTRSRSDEGSTDAGSAGPEGAPGDQLAHVAFYMPQQGNAGDKVLPETVRLALGTDTGPGRWHSIHAHRLFDEAALERVNARRGLVVGGGGLFIPDTAPNGNSGWQWNVPTERLDRIEVPLVVYAVGFNAFDGQTYRRDRFHAALRQLVERSAFFGLRNHGSIEKVRALLPAELHEKVRFQPCPTTVTRQLTEGWTDPAEREDTVLINAAYDRAGLRFGHDYGYFLGQMARAVRALGARTEVKCVAHALDDEKIVYDLRREHGISLPVVPMYDFDNAAIWDTYARTRLVIGMRGHAGMIPFGCGTPIISLISHPKMAYFLSDIERPEWGISVHDKDLGALLTERALGLLDDQDAAVADVHDRQLLLWRATQENSRHLSTVLGTPAL